jgi:hypothetical protein
MATFTGWARRRRFRIAVGVLAAAIVAGGTVLGVALTGSGSKSPSTAAGAGTSGNSGTSGTSGQGSPHDVATTGGTGSGTGGAADNGTGGGSGGASGTGASPSTSAPPIKVSVICTVVSGNLMGTITLSSCSQLQSTGGSGTFPASVLTSSGTSTVTWNGKGTTTFVYAASHGALQSRKCPSGDSETTLKGAAVSNVALGPDNVGVKGPLHAKLCVDPHFNVSLAPGKAFQL